MKFLNLFFCLFALYFTIAFPNICKDGVIAAINICMYTVLPSLFPAIVITNILVKKNLTNYIATFFHPLFHFLFKTSKSGTYAILMGLLCGYPTGLKNLQNLYKNNQISHDEYLYLIKFVNNPSPSFLYGYAYPFIFNKYINIWEYVLYIYIPVLITGLICRFNNNYKYSDNKNDTNNNFDIINNSLKSLSVICFYIYIFSILASFIDHFVTVDTFKEYVYVCLEITGGLSRLISNSSNIHILIILFAISTGGLCVTMQSLSFLKDKKEKLNYLYGKFLICIVTAIIFLCVSNLSR